MGGCDSALCFFHAASWLRLSGCFCLLGCQSTCSEPHCVRLSQRTRAEVCTPGIIALFHMCGIPSTIAAVLAWWLIREVPGCDAWCRHTDSPALGFGCAQHLTNGSCSHSRGGYGWLRFHTVTGAAMKDTLSKSAGSNYVFVGNQAIIRITKRKRRRS